MNVADKDTVVHGMLEEEYRRCKEVLNALQQKLAHFSKGALNARKKGYKDTQYIYHYLVYREAGRVINRHVSDSELPVMVEQMEQRDKCITEIRAYRKRVVYLEKLLQVANRKSASDENAV